MTSEEMTTNSHAIAIRAARSALVITQAEFSALAGLSRASLARFETLERPVRIGQFEKMQQVLADRGVEVIMREGGASSIEISMGAAQLSALTLGDEENRRADRGKVGSRKQMKPGNEEALP